jgi:hypothetical protein
MTAIKNNLTKNVQIKTDLSNQVDEKKLDEILPEDDDLSKSGYIVPS